MSDPFHVKQQVRYDDNITKASMRLCCRSAAQAPFGLQQGNTTDPIKANVALEPFSRSSLIFPCVCTRRCRPASAHMIL